MMRLHGANTHLVSAILAAGTPASAAAGGGDIPAAGARPNGRRPSSGAPSGAQAEGRYAREDVSTPPMRLPTEEGRYLVAERNRDIHFQLVLLVYTIAIIAIGFVAGQLFQQMQIDERRWQAEQRV